MALTVVQQAVVLDCGSKSVPLPSSLVCAGVTPTEAETLARDVTIIALWKAGRAEASRKVRSALFSSAISGNVAARCLNLDAEPELDPVLKARRAEPIRVDAVKSVDEAFARQKKLITESGVLDNDD